MISRHGQIAEGSSEQTGDYGDYPVDFTLYPVDEFHPLMEQRINQSVLESDGDLSSEPDNVETKTGVAGHKDPTGKSARTHKQKQQRIADSPQTSPTQSGRRSRLPRQTSPSRDDAAISKTNSPQQMLPPTALPKRITRKRPSSREGSPATSAGTKKSRESSPMRSETANNSPSPSAVATRRGLSTAQDRQNPLTYSSAAKPNKRSSVRPAVANDEGSGASSATMKIGRRSLRKH
jgi:hypothetical protein